MAVLTIRNVPEEVHRALQARAKKQGKSMEAEVRDILNQSLGSQKQVKFGTLLNSIAKEAGGLTDEEAEAINQLRDRTPAEPMQFD